MIRWLLRFFPLALFIGFADPATAQYIYLDTNADGRCDYHDVDASVGLVDIYLDTSHDDYGSEVACASGEPLSIFSYEILLHAACGNFTPRGGVANASGEATPVE
jgi:hypothetical protein